MSLKYCDSSAQTCWSKGSLFLLVPFFGRLNTQGVPNASAKNALARQTNALAAKSDSNGKAMTLSTEGLVIIFVPRWWRLNRFPPTIWWHVPRVKIFFRILTSGGADGVAYAMITGFLSR
jgi:hypothetical protein